MESASLTALAAEELAVARAAASGRAAHTICGGPEHALRQTVLAIASGHGLAEHDTPDEASLHVLCGSVRLATSTEAWTGSSGDYIVIPPERHTLTALTDSAVLLTVVRQRS